MALKTGERPEKSVGEDVAGPQPVDTIVLELTMYVNYTWNGETYHAGTPYRFKRDDAMILMSEQDHERPIWRIYQPPKIKKAQRAPEVDSTEVKAVRTRQSLEEAGFRDTRKGTNTGKRIDVGTDEEIADILDRPDFDASGDVTV
jgi:hypothetical protein